MGLDPHTDPALLPLDRLNRSHLTALLAALVKGILKGQSLCVLVVPFLITSIVGACIKQHGSPTRCLSRSEFAGIAVKSMSMMQHSV